MTIVPSHAIPEKIVNWQKKLTLIIFIIFQLT